MLSQLPITANAAGSPPPPAETGFFDEDDPRIKAFIAWLVAVDERDSRGITSAAQRLLRLGFSVETRRPAARMAADILDDPRLRAFALAIISLDSGNAAEFCQGVQGLRRMGVRLVAVEMQADLSG